MFNFLALSYAGRLSITIVCLVLLVLAVLFVALGFVFFHIALGSKRRKDETVPCKNSLFERNAENKQLQDGYRWYDENYKQKVTCKSRKGKTLHAMEFRNPSNSNIWVICLHGWTNVKREMSPYAMEYYRRGFNVLIPDLRGHGDSESKYVSMGWLDRLDVVDWINSLVEENPRVKITLHGVSMGSATVMMMAGDENLPENVRLIVADCGYTSPREITRKCLPEYLPGMPLELTYAVGRLGAILFGHFDPEDADCEAAAAQSKVPILFVHGDADGFVPYDMGKRNYEACRAKGKKFLTVHGAEHAVSYYHDNDAYTKQATEFLQDCLARRGFVWPPETDEPEK